VEAMRDAASAVGGRREYGGMLGDKHRRNGGIGPGRRHGLVAATNRHGTAGVDAQVGGLGSTAGAGRRRNPSA
jgi:hypothetical protein